MRRAIRVLLWALLLFLTAAAAAIRLRYGGGQPYPDVTGEPVLPKAALENVVSYHEPIGNVAVSRDGRLFFTVHPEARPEGAKLLEWKDGAARPFPDEAAQDRLFETPLGVVIDRRDRLWVIDHGNHGFGTPRLLAFDLGSGALVHDHRFPDHIAPLGSFLQDLQVTPDGSTVFIADASFWRQDPALVVHDVGGGRDRRLLEHHDSVMAQNWIIVTPSRTMSFLGGLAAMKPALDGIALAADGSWLAYGAMTHDTLYRVPTSALVDPHLEATELAARVERLGQKPLSDGLSSDREGGVWITDVEHGAVLRMTPERVLETWIETPRIRWADALCFGPDGWLYVADSALPDVVLRSRAHIADHGPYFISRFRPGVSGVPGH
jgi:sugar lactone lactonase YvrE